MEPTEIVVRAQVPLPAAQKKLVRLALKAALRYLKAPADAGLTCLLADDEALRRLNHTFRQVDAPTDVLSFAAGDPMPETAYYLGDIAISVPAAERQGRAAGHALTAELQLLAVHGVLHMLGYDHEEAGERERMWEAQAAIMTLLGWPDVQPTEA